MNREERISLANSRKAAKESGKTIFFADFKCEVCGSYECYTNQKGRACVICKFKATEKRRKEQPEKVRAERREYNNRNRPAHNPESFVFDGVRRAGYLEAAPHTQAEFDALSLKCSFLKSVNGDYAEYTNDHIAPAGGFILNGEKCWGRTIAPNISIMPIEENKALSNKKDFDGKNIKRETYITEKDKTLTSIPKDLTTEGLRELFWNEYKIKTRQPNQYERKLDDGTIETVYRKKEPLSYIETMRRSVILEIMMAGYAVKDDVYPLDDKWDNDKQKYVKPVIYVNKDLHNKEVIQALFRSLHWLETARGYLLWQKTGIPLSEDYQDLDIKNRIEQHFIEWVNRWSQDMNNSKYIYDFLRLPPRKDKFNYIGAHLVRRDLKLWKAKYDNIPKPSDEDKYYYACQCSSAWNMGKSAGCDEKFLKSVWESEGYMCESDFTHWVNNPPAIELPY
ncbi:hypothetical protein LJ038_004906 [Salmonella enterica]|nr:hypothetical protein [Salmonella enterica]